MRLFTLALLVPLAVACNKSATGTKPSLAYVVTLDAKHSACKASGQLQPLGGGSVDGSFIIPQIDSAKVAIDTVWLPGDGPAQYAAMATLTLYPSFTTRDSTWTASVPGAVTFTC